MCSYSTISMKLVFLSTSALVFNITAHLHKEKLDLVGQSRDGRVVLAWPLENKTIM